METPNLIDNRNEVIEFINTNIKPNQSKRQTNGTVFTPMQIIDDMLDKLDEYYETQNDRSIFTEIAFKWFDPASGFGNFPMAVYLRLMDGLEMQFPDYEERKKHIIEKMLYMSELDTDNIDITKQLFQCDYELNLYEGDTLELDTDVEWNVTKFDVVMGNPPYNSGGIKSCSQALLGETNQTIWPLFVARSLEWLKPSGFLAFITPNSWLKQSHKLHDDILENYIVYLEYWDSSQSKKIIRAEIPISLYILQNRWNVDETTEIVSIISRKRLRTTSNVVLDANYSIPLAHHAIFEKITRFIENDSLQLEFKTKTVKSTGERIRLEDIDEDDDEIWSVDTYLVKEGIMVKKTISQHPDTFERKLIISNKSSFKGAFIDDRQLGLTGTNKKYILGDNLELVLKIIEFKLSDIISEYTKYSMDFIDSEAFKYLPDLRKMDIDDITELEYYRLIGFTNEEIWEINPSIELDFDIEE